MKINKLELINFRQYIEAKFDFTEKVTIINGENGVGKSTFMGSIIYALYGQEELFSTNLMRKDADFLFANRKFISNGICSKPESIVTLEIESEEGEKFLIVREYNNITKEERVSIKKGTIESGYVFKELEDMTEYQNIIPKEIAPLLFFDGERIKSIQEVIGSSLTTNFRDEIEKIVKLDEKKNVRKIIKSAQKKIIQSSNISDVENKQVHYDKAQINVEQSEHELKNIETEIDILKKEKEDLNLYLKQNEEAKNRVKILEQLNCALENERVNRISKENILKRDLIINKPNWMKIQYFEKIKDKVNHGEDLYQIAGIEQKAIDFILQNENCICSTKLTTELKYNLERLKTTLPPESFQSILNATVAQKGWLENNRKEKIGEQKQILKSKKKEDEISEEIYQTREHYSDSDEVIYSKEKRLNEIDKILEKLFGDKGKHNDIIEKNLRLSEKLSNEIDKAMKIEMKNKELELVREYLKEAEDELTEEIEDRIGNIQYELTSSANKYAKKLLRDSVEIELDNKLRPKKILLGNGTESISTGQSVVVSMAYLFGLIDIMNNDLRIEKPEKYPIILDGVTASLDPNHIKNIMDETQNYKGQVIILGNTTQINEIMNNFPNGKTIYTIDREIDSEQTKLGEKVWNSIQM